MVRKSIAVLIGIMVLTGCRKPVENPEDILPKVETNDAFIDTDGLFTIKGTILSTGSTELYNLGACYNFVGNPEMNENQLYYTSLTGDEFTIKYQSIPVASPVYCRVWATNNDTYGYGNVIKLENLVVPNVTAPCTPTTNTIDLGDGNGEFNMYTVTSPSGGNCYAEAVNGRSLTFEFAGAPGTAEYTTTTNTPLSNQVRITVSVNSVTDYALAGYTVYVNQSGSGVWNIQLCDVGWSPFSSTLNITADINYPL